MVKNEFQLPSFPELRPRIGVKFRPSAPFSPQGAHGDPTAPWQTLGARFPDLQLEPFFIGLSPEGLEYLERQARASGGAPRFASWRAITVPLGVDAAELLQAVASWPQVELAYVECGAVPPSVSPADDPRSSSQRYLAPAPQGIDAYFAWAEADGSGIGFVDLEQAWTLDHEDLPAPMPFLGAGSLLQNDEWIAHGTAVLGIVAAVDNDKGVIGIAPGCSVRVVSQWFDQPNAKFISTASAIATAITQMNAGDVLLIESSSIVPDPKFGLLPAEVDPVVFDLIKTATGNGITVVEPAGNNDNGSNLDAFRNGSGASVFNRIEPTFRDSGAIMVGAASSSLPHQRLWYSNYGSRVDCFAWGWDISTCGGYPRTGSGSPQTAYMTDFAGTSGASAIVAGAAVLLQSWAAKHGGTLSTARLREVMSDPYINTPSSAPANDRIGVMPDLRGIIQHLRAPVRGRDDIIRAILFGAVAQDGPGFVWTPGGGLTPVGPRVDRTAQSQSRDKHDLLLGLTIYELAGLVSDPAQRQMIQRLSGDLMRSAVQGITARTG
jgi:hypothetical protein